MTGCATRCFRSSPRAAWSSSPDATKPATAWRTDVDWAALTRIHRLGNLGPDESRTYLTRCGVPAEHHDEALAFTRGHPLALSLIADVLTRGDRLTSSRLDAEPEIVRLLIEKFVQEVPSREHRLALHACVTRAGDDGAASRGGARSDDAHDLFEWLGHLSFIERARTGCSRTISRATWSTWISAGAIRTPRIGSSSASSAISTSGSSGRRDSTRLRVWFDLIYLQRYNPHLRPFLEWAGFGTTYAETASAADHATILEMVERHEGRSRRRSPATGWSASRRHFSASAAWRRA